MKRELLTPSQQKSVAKAIARGIHKQEQREKAPTKGHKINLFLDSGVFSAWNRKTSLDVKQYCEFIKRNEAYLQCYATMDVIPGTFGEKRTQKEVDESAKGSYANQQLMKGRGLKPIPIFHQGENERWLEKYIADGEQYVGISTAKDLRNSEQRDWLDRIFSMITDAKGTPYIKTHGFGITNISLLLRYPWFTADSTTWSLAAGYGLIYVPRFRDGKPDYSSIPMRIITSGRQQAAWSSAKRQYEALNPVDLEWVKQWLAYVGVSQEEVRYKSSSRRAACLKYFVEFGLHYPIKPFDLDFRKRRTGLLEPEIELRVDVKPQKLWSNMRIMMATMMHNGQFSQILNNAGADNRLVSYWEIMSRPEELLHAFVQHGITDLNYKPRPARDDWDNETYLSQRAMKHLERIKSYGPSETD